MLDDASAEGSAARVLWKELEFEPTVALREGDDAPRVPSPPLTSPKPPILLRFPELLELHHPESFLSRLLGDIATRRYIADLDDIRVAQVWSLVGLATLGRRDSDSGFEPVGSRWSTASQFAHAVGLDDVISGQVTERAPEPERTFPLQRIAEMSQIEKAASRISRLMLPHDDDARKTRGRRSTT